MNKLMNFFMNHGLIFLNTAPTLQNIVLMIVDKHILIIWNVSGKSAINSISVHILHHHFRGGWGSRAMMMLMMQGGGGGGPKLAKSWWCNICTLPKQNPPLTTCKRQDLNCLWSFFVASLKSVHRLCNHFRGVGGGRGVSGPWWFWWRKRGWGDQNWANPQYVICAVHGPLLG